MSGQGLLLFIRRSYMHLQPPANEICYTVLCCGVFAVPTLSRTRELTARSWPPSSCWASSLLAGRGSTKVFSPRPCCTTASGDLTSHPSHPSHPPSCHRRIAGGRHDWPVPERRERLLLTACCYCYVCCCRASSSHDVTMRSTCVWASPELPLV